MFPVKARNFSKREMVLIKNKIFVVCVDVVFTYNTEAQPESICLYESSFVASQRYKLDVKRQQNVMLNIYDVLECYS